MVVSIQGDILRLSAMGLLEPLLKDKSTKGNILWATDAYADRGVGYGRGEEIRTERITGKNSDLIKTRARRAMEQRTERTRQHAEVFTPLRIVKKMIDAADEQWFGRKAGFYKLSPEGRVSFTKEKTWKKYVDARRLEITCGEAPFLVTRYDVETGDAIRLEERFGLLDRKLRAVSENAADMEEWKTWALRAVQSIYGYELQGDNLLIARVNLLCSAEEHMEGRWRRKPDKAWLEKLCNVISWNLWQMDGLTGCVPTEPEPSEEQLSLFPPEPRFEQESLFGEKEEKEIPCRLFDWRGDHSIGYQALREKGPELMKFDFIIGNPPYQDDPKMGSTRALPIYNAFMEEAYEISDRVLLITPARFLFNAGQTKKEWNEKMLADPHLKVVYYEPDSSKIFSTTDIAAGIVITFHNNLANYKPIGTFVKIHELRSIVEKVAPLDYRMSLTSIADSQNNYNFSELYKDHPDYARYISDNGRHSQLKTNALTRVPMFTENKQNADDLRIFGLINGKRGFRYCNRRYIKLSHSSLMKYKILIAKAGGSGHFGDVLSEPIIVGPNDGFTQTFLSIGAFDSIEAANSLSKYIKTKFCRAMLGVLKVTQDNPPEKWKCVPLQDFTPASDIDWSKSIPEIDKQLYAKYGLDEAEIEFIETHVKEMT